jgi:CSLREA domain-containing protein
VRVGEAGGRSVVAGLLAALITLACALAMPAAAAAEDFTVNSTTDEEDVAPGVGGCESAAGKCTLRAAIEEANSLEGEDRIFFEREEVFDGQITGTISLDSGLPPIVGPISILGECVITEGLRPCVGVDGPDPSEPALVVENSEAEIHGLAITGAGTGIEVVGSPRLRVSSNWLGVRLDGSAGGNETGVLLGKGSENVRIGNEGESNVFANNTGDGLDIHGVSNVRVMGGYFGVGPDGSTPAPNGGKDIEVASFEGSDAVGNRIGTQLTPEAAATQVCDGGCNVISDAGLSGVDLEGDGGEEAPAAATVIVGNYVGLDASGTAVVANAADGVHVGPAARTVIGGPRASEANRFAGGQTAIQAGPGAANLVVRGNSIGVGSTGADLAAPDDGVLINSGGLPNAATEAAIAGNEIRMQGGIGIDQTGLGGWISGNLIAGADIGIRAAGETEEHGNLIEANLIEGSSANGILLESNFNEVLGNEVLGSGGAGILVEGAPFPFGISGNVIGGDTEFGENLVAVSGGAAIEISNLKETNNEVARNQGFANAGRFIDLVAASPATEPKGPNKGIESPVFAFATRSRAGGSGAEPDARIRVFRKASAEPGEIESFVGEAVADEDGTWEVIYDDPIPAGTRVAATQTARGIGTSELAFAAVPPESGGGGGGQGCTLGGCGSPPAVAQPTPETRISKGPKAKSHSTTATFKFSATVSGSTFQCKLDEAQFKPCESPRKYKKLKPGKHVFEVRAVNPAGVADPTPAKRKFTVLG